MEESPVTCNKINDLSSNLNKYSEDKSTINLVSEDVFRMNNKKISKYCCYECMKYYKTKRKYLSHFRRRHNKCYACNICLDTFYTEEALKNHNITFHNQIGTYRTEIEINKSKMIRCFTCKIKFPTQLLLDQHLKSCSAENISFQCQFCPAIRQTLQDLNEHKQIHENEYRCDTCHLGFSTTDELIDHGVIHDVSGKPYICFICTIGFLSSEELTDHLKLTHKNEDIPTIAAQHLCTLCGEVFQESNQLARHLKDFHIVLVVGEISLVDNDINIKDSFTTKCK